MRFGAAIFYSPRAPNIAVDFLKRRVADALMRGDDATVSRLTRALDLVMNYDVVPQTMASLRQPPWPR